MQHASIIPECDRPRSPCKPAGELRLDLKIKQVFQQRLTFLLCPPCKPDSVPRVDIERLSPGLRVRADNRVFGNEFSLGLFGRRIREPVFARLRHGRLGRGIDRFQTPQYLLQTGGKRLEGGVTAGKKSISAKGRKFAGNEHRRSGRLLQVSRIGVPDATKIMPLLWQFQYGNNQRIIGQPLHERVFDDLAESLGERHECGGIERLVAKKYDAMLQPDSTDSRNRVVVGRLVQINPGYFGTHATR